MQNRRWLATAVFLGITLAAVSVRAELKVGVVDLQKAMELSEEGKKAKAVFQTKVEKIQQELKEKQDRLAAVKEELDRQASMLSATARADKERDYQDKLRDFKRLYEDYQEEMRRQDAELSEKILRRMIEVIEGIGVKDGYDLILEKTQSAVLYRSNSIDLTDQLIKMFDKSNKKP
jgi:outer membrane protein